MRVIFILAVCVLFLINAINSGELLSIIAFFIFLLLFFYTLLCENKR